MKSIRTYRSGFENLKMNMKVNQDDVNNLQGLSLTCGKGSNLAIAPPELAIWRNDALGFTPPTTKRFSEAREMSPRVQGKS